MRGLIVLNDTATNHYLGAEGKEATHQMKHDLALELDGIMSAFDGVHPNHVAAALEEYARAYRRDRLDSTQWAPKDFYELTDDFDELPEGEELLARLDGASTLGQQAFVDACNNVLEEDGGLTLEWRGEIARHVLGEESPREDLKITDIASVDTLQGVNKVRVYSCGDDHQIGVDPTGLDLDAGQARAVAAALLSAANRLDTLRNRVGARSLPRR